MPVAEEKQKEQYFDNYWQSRDLSRVSRRAEWRARRLFSWVGNRYHNLLDVGAGNGELLFYFRTAGYRVEGWDVSPQVVEHLRRGGYRARVVDVEAESIDGYYELICCCELLQHLEDPPAVINKLERILAPQGRMYITVPNEFHLVRRLRLKQQEESHMTLFSPKRARDLVEICGLEIEEISYQPLIPPRWGRVLLMLGGLLARLLPSLFSLSTLMLVKRPHDN
jgi:2-polyprenyl-3-methyl-5-hydroxy-6-metoxy-1,4-benzoquinol methylase